MFLASFHLFSSLFLPGERKIAAQNYFKKIIGAGLIFLSLSFSFVRKGKEKSNQKQEIVSGARFLYFFLIPF